jgi:hypothetical protein
MEFIFSGAKEHGELMCDAMAAQLASPVLTNNDIIHEKETIANELGRYAADPARNLSFNLDVIRYP